MKKGAPLANIPEEGNLVLSNGSMVHLESQPHEGDLPERNATTPEASKKPRDPMSRIHPVPGYPDSENMWEKVWSLEKGDTYQTKYPNHRSEFLFSVNESRQVKVKRNPLYKKILKEMMRQHEKIHQQS